jgi:hypothetical protein
VKDASALVEMQQQRKALPAPVGKVTLATPQGEPAKVDVRTPLPVNVIELVKEHDSRPER